MKKLFLGLLLIGSAFISQAQFGTFKAVRFVNVNTPADTLAIVSSPVEGTIFYNGVSDKFRVYENGAWHDLGSGTGGGGGVGTVTSVGFTGGLISVANPTTTPAFTVAGTSGGIPYFSSSSTWASSAALTANALVIGGGGGAAPAPTPTGTGILTALGNNIGSAGAPVVFNGAGGTPSSMTGTNITGIPISGVTSLQTSLDAKANKAMTYNTQTANYIVALTDLDTKIVRQNVASANTVTIQPFATIAYPEGAVVNVENLGAGTTTLTPGAGVTFTYTLGSSATLLQNGFATAIHTPTQNTWRIHNPSGGGSAFTKVDDTNVTVTLGGSPLIALNASMSFTLGWTGTLSQGRGGKGDGTVYTQGSLLFQGSGSKIDEDNANLFYNKSTVLMGIGTATPTSRLSFMAGTTSANTAQIDALAGSLETTIRAGVLNYGAAEWYVSGLSLNRRSPIGIIYTAFADVNNAGASPTETDMMTYTTKVNTLSVNGDNLILEASGTFNDATSTPRIQVYFGGTSIGDTGALTITGTPFYNIRTVLVRTAATTVRATVSITSTSGLTVAYVKETDLTGLTLTNTNIIKYTGISSGAGGSASDITHKMGFVMFAPTASN